MKPICIITARGNSKRLKNKNIKNFFGKPMISYPISIAKNSKLFSRIIVSTDSKKISRISRKFGAEIPFMRSKKLSDDFAKTNDVLKDAIRKSGSHKTKYIFCIYPTAVLINEKDLKKAFYLMKKNNFDFLIAVTDYNYNPMRSLIFNKGKLIKYKWKKYSNTRSQDLPYLFHDTGSFYIFKTSTILKNKKKNKIGSYFLDRLRSIDIDTKEDFELAKILFKYQKKKIENYSKNS